MGKALSAQLLALCLQVKKEKQRLERSTNKHALSEEATKLDLISEICTAAKDLASILSGGKLTLQDDIVEKVAACDKAGVVLSSFARAECVRAKCDIMMRVNRYSEFADILMESSTDIRGLEEADLDADTRVSFAMEQVERCAIGLFETIPEEVSSKAATKFKTDAIKMLEAVGQACEKPEFLAKAFLEQAKAGPGLLSFRSAIWPAGIRTL